MKPPFSYYGGKQRIATKILPHFPRHTVYVEPFCGGATMLFKKPWPPDNNQSNYREVINDKNETLINFFRVLQDPIDAEKLFRKLDFTLYSRAEWIKAKQILNSKNPNKIDLAWAWYVKIQTSFSNVLHGGWRTGTYGRNPQATFTNNKNLRSYVDRMQSIAIECDGALSVIERWDSPQTLFYCDPPYPGSDQGHYKGYTHEDLKALFNLALKSQGSFVISNYVQNYSPKDFRIVTIKARMCAAMEESDTKKERIEYLYILDRSENAKPEIKKIWQKWEQKGIWG